MQTIELKTEIAAPPERCFLLSLNIDLHVASTSGTREQAVAGTTHGMIGPGERVTWRGRHFGLMLTHESEITAYEPFHHFQDVMVRGLFRSFEHDHYFSATETGTVMKDRLRFAAPFWPMSVVVERYVLRDYMRSFLQERNEYIRRVAESKTEEWRQYVQ